MTVQPTRPHGSITVGFDGSASGHSAVHWAADEADARGARLRIVTAWDPSPVTPWNLPDLTEWRTEARAFAESEAARARAAVGAGLHIDAIAVEGNPGQVLVAESLTADLLVVGSAGHVGLRGVLAGSVSRHCLHRACCPVVVVGPEAEVAPASRLVLSSTLDPQGETFATVSAFLATRSLPVHVIASFCTSDLAELQLPETRAEVRTAVQAQNDAWIHRLRSATGIAVVTEEVVEGQAQHVLERHTGRGDLLIVPSGCEHYLPLEHGPCPIAVAPSPRHAASHDPVAVGATGSHVGAGTR